MRLIAFTLAVFVGGGPAAAQNWQEYSYPDFSFRVTFPADPQIETTTYQVADDRSVEAHVYSVHQDNSVLKITVAELADIGLAESAVIDQAIKTLSEGGEVKVNIPHRINRVYGRQLSILGADGSYVGTLPRCPGARRAVSDLPVSRFGTGAVVSALVAFEH